MTDQAERRDDDFDAGGFSFSPVLLELGEDAGLHVECHSLRWRAFGMGVIIGSSIASIFWIIVCSFFWALWRLING